MESELDALRHRSESEMEADSAGIGEPCLAPLHAPPQVTSLPTCGIQSGRRVRFSDPAKGHSSFSSSDSMPVVLSLRQIAARWSSPSSFIPQSTRGASSSAPPGWELVTTFRVA